MEEKSQQSPHRSNVAIFRKHLNHNIFKYNHTDSKWIDVDYVISTVTMSYHSTNEVCTLNRNDSEQLSKFVT